jgi:hypothetical protein
LLGAALGPRLELAFAQTVGFGAEDDATPSVDPASTHVLALFDLGATPEIENQGRFVRALRDAAPGGAGVVALVDAGAFTRRFGGVGARVGERGDAWRAWSEAVAVPLAIVDLEEADQADAARALEAAFAAPQAATPGAIRSAAQHAATSGKRRRPALQAGTRRATPLRAAFRSASSRSPTPARRRSRARSTAATSARFATRRSSPSSPTCTR